MNCMQCETWKHFTFDIFWASSCLLWVKWCTHFHYFCSRRRLVVQVSRWEMSLGKKKRYTYTPRIIVVIMYVGVSQLTGSFVFMSGRSYISMFLCMYICMQWCSTLGRLTWSLSTAYCSFNCCEDIYIFSPISTTIFFTKFCIFILLQFIVKWKNTFSWNFLRIYV